MKASDRTPARCAYTACMVRIPGRYGEPGVSLSRVDNDTMICDACGRREAFAGPALVELHRGNQFNASAVLP